MRRLVAYRSRQTLGEKALTQPYRIICFSGLSEYVAQAAKQRSEGLTPS